MNKKRADQLIQEYFPELSRSKIQTLISKSKISIETKDGPVLVKKPGEKIDDSIPFSSILIAADDELKYVSRGALKLKKALDFFNINPEKKVCLDIGLSTGGFTDLLLQKGASQVMGVDVGKEQLHSKLKIDDRLVWFDKVNARYPFEPEILEKFFGEKERVFDLIVVDVSFISLSLIIPNAIQYLADGGYLVCLVKPQFELSRGDLNSKGVVKDVEKANQALQKIIGVFEENKLKQVVHCDSPIEGDDGNKEFLVSGVFTSSSR